MALKLPVMLRHVDPDKEFRRWLSSELIPGPDRNLTLAEVKIMFEINRIVRDKSWH